MKRFAWIAGLAALAVLAGCERPPVDSVQRGHRGTGMLEVYNPRILAEQAPAQTAPPPLAAAPAEGPKAGTIYQNVKVLGDLSIAEFTRTMQAMTNWVSPNEGCAYCHNLQNLADDSLYTKVVSRRMLEMTRHINASWKPHVAETGVTCYTCHRGQHIPQEVWFDQQPQRANFAGNKDGQNHPVAAVGYASLPENGFDRYLKKDDPIRVIAHDPLPTGHVATIKSTEGTYGLMMHMSKGLGVNCTYCHNSRSFAEWDQSTPQRGIAWHGIRMVRDLNLAYMEPLANVFPASRLGPGGDVAKANCATCHQGVFKPLGGAAMAADYPALQVPKP